MRDFTLTSESAQILAAFGVYLVGVMALGIISHRFLKRGSFVKEYFIGNRGLGPWVLALTIAATAVSGGTFMGFPSFIYRNGWIMALWIASYMIVPLTTMAVMGKRLNQFARISGAVTLPDVLRDRFQSPVVGIVATLVILVCLTVNLVAQFKAGGTVIMIAMGVTDRPEYWRYVVGLIVFAATVIAYTTYGGFWAVTWTDVLEGVVMLVGVVALAFLAIQAVPSHSGQTGLAAATSKLQEINPALVSGPGPNDFLPLSGAFSFFLMWSIVGMGQPGGMVRLMAFKDTASLRRAIMLVCGYYVLTYVSLILIFICARAIFPTQYLGTEGSEGQGKPDEIMPVMIRHVSPHPFIAGMLLAAPYAAIMSTVAAFLLLISSSLVRDIYQRTIHPAASTRRLRILSFVVTAGVGILVMVAALDPPDFLQYIIVFSTSGMGCAFALPIALTIYWKRTTKQGVLAGMLGGSGTVFLCYALGWIHRSGRLHETLSWLWALGRVPSDKAAPFGLAGLDPLVWGLGLSLVLTVTVSLITKLDRERVTTYFPE